MPFGFFDMIAAAASDTSGPYGNEPYGPPPPPATELARPRVGRPRRDRKAIAARRRAARKSR